MAADLDPAGRYSIAVVGLRDEAAREAVALYLASVVRGKTLLEVTESLGRLPYLVTRAVPGGVARKLTDGLEERGATVEAVPVIQSNTASETGPGMPGDEGGGTVEGEGPFADTRPGSIPVPPILTATGPRQVTIPWEDREEQGLITSLWGTFTQVLFSPSEFYATMPPTGAIGSALLYAVILSVLGLILSAPAAFLTRVTFLGNIHMPAEDAYAILLGVYTFGVFFSPIFFIIGYYVLAAIYHVCILIVGGTGGFQATLKVLTYSASTSVFQVLPFLGGIVSGVYSMALWSIGFQKAHSLPPARATFAVVFPFIVIFLLVLAIVSLLIFGFGIAILQGIAHRLQYPFGG